MVESEVNLFGGVRGHYLVDVADQSLTFQVVRVPLVAVVRVGGDRLLEHGALGQALLVKGLVGEDGMSCCGRVV